MEIWGNPVFKNLPYIFISCIVKLRWFDEHPQEIVRVIKSWPISWHL